MYHKFDYKAHKSTLYYFH